MQTGEAITFGNDLAFSGTSINKVAILADFYRFIERPPDPREATDIANMMICSENVATNRMLALIGNGDEYRGADELTLFLRQLGLERTFLTAPYVTNPDNIPTPQKPIRFPTTTADQIRANPDPSNQMTVEEMGWLLSSIYQCAYQEDGPLMTGFPGAYSSRECRQMLHVMSNNTVDALLKTGVPEGTRVAHKHGWIDDTHGNAAVFFTPGGDYVMVMMLHQPDWLFFEESLPLMSEVSREVFNFYNPEQPMAEIREGFIPEAASCGFGGTPLIGDLTASVFP
jgi:beta-lactamase class A